MTKSHGGLRNPPGGRPPNKVKRVKANTSFLPETVTAAKQIAKDNGLPGWGWAVDEAIAMYKIALDAAILAKLTKEKNDGLKRGIYDD